MLYFLERYHSAWDLLYLASPILAALLSTPAFSCCFDHANLKISQVSIVVGIPPKKLPRSLPQVFWRNPKANNTRNYLLDLSHKKLSLDSPKNQDFGLQLQTPLRLYLGLVWGVPTPFRMVFRALGLDDPMRASMAFIKQGLHGALDPIVSYLAFSRSCWALAGATFAIRLLRDWSSAHGLCAKGWRDGGMVGAANTCQDKVGDTPENWGKWGYL